LADGERFAEVTGADLGLEREPLQHPEAGRVGERLQLADETILGHAAIVAPTSENVYIGTRL